MKIWYQSGASLGIDPAWDEYEQTLKTYLNQVARPGTQVDVHGVELFSHSDDKYRFEEFFHDGQIVQNAIRAEREGYDAFCVGCARDPAGISLREVVDIPVSNLLETSMHMACLLSPNFSLLAHGQPLLRRQIELVKRYGLSERFIECNSFEVTLDELQGGFSDPKVIMDPAMGVAEEAKRKGVCMFVNACGCLNAVMGKYCLRELGGIPVLDGAALSIKMVEMLVDLKAIGVGRSKLGAFTPVPKDILASVMKLYGVV
ncbi:Hydantoin racemase [Georgfuchsia toluolica]|uniref:Hydantoin racemase n=1 Tax=Georgfuchsia toluolica TaxID=424218 RepID=A0A916J6I9_9PROT|nr:aspartate/glutamate racemase family protein [Georgfuchsia toluolica]CAG4885151.1 Hydantoin racemase [Georgfuchsia toluolica]